MFLALLIWLFGFQSQTIQINTTQYENTNGAIIRIWQKDAPVGLAIANCETGLQPHKINWADSKITGMPSQGLFQLNRPYDEKYLNFQLNTEEAKKLYDRRGVQPWYNCGKKLGLL